MDLMHPVGEVQWQTFEISKDEKRKMKGHSSTIVWLTGLPARTLNVF